jgi:hypothetical protein
MGLLTICREGLICVVAKRRKLLVQDIKLRKYSISRLNVFAIWSCGTRTTPPLLMSPRLAGDRNHQLEPVDRHSTPLGNESFRFRTVSK